jgi:lipoate-protein ligase A
MRVTCEEFVPAGVTVQRDGVLFATLTEIADPEPHDAALNMALDEVLLRAARGPVLRIYRWARPAVSFGYFGKFAEVGRAWAGRELVRRWTGGGVVPHGDDFTYTLIVPASDPFSRVAARESYRHIHERVAAALREAGCVVSMAPSAQEKVSNACFENAVESDLIAASGKVAGAAQRRTQWGLLHQGSIQIAGLDAKFATLFSAMLAPQISQREWEPDEPTAARDLAAQKYATQEWLTLR